MSLTIQKKVDLSQHTTLHVGGVATYFVEVSSVADLMEALVYAKEHTERAPLIIGGGSNLLIFDGGYDGLVIKNNIKGVDFKETNTEMVLVSCGAGEMLDDVVAQAVAKNYWGLENLSAIPGTVGATPVQNVGAYGVEVSSLIIEVEAVNMITCETKIFTCIECAFGYRDSFFKTTEGKQWFITRVVFGLSNNVQPKLTYGSLAELGGHKNITPQHVRDAVQKIRSEKFPDWKVVGTAGSFFKNPTVSKRQYESLLKQYPELPGYEIEDGRVKLSLGWILDKICGLRGYCEGAVCLYEKQALVLTNTGTSAAAIDFFQKKISSIVKEKIFIDIETEVTFIK